jgi:dTDP-4-amino-4,6-dideoxygalactose transaminase
MKIPFSKPSIGGEEANAAACVIRSGWLAAGKETEAFEQEFSDYISPPSEHYYCIFTNSCTSALKMAYNIAKEMGVREICYPANTFVATYSAAAELGLAICSRGGYDGTICQNNHIHVDNAEADFLTSTTSGKGGSSVLSHVIGRAEEELGLPLIPKSSQGNVSVQQLSSRSSEVHPSVNNPSTQQYTDGSSGSTAKQPPAIFAEESTGWVGQTEVSSTSKNAPTGNASVLNATTTTTSPSVARVNVHLGSVKDKTPCLIEDSAHRIEPNDPLVGTMRCYSFYATKNMTTGSGGMFVTNRKDIYDIARTYWKDGLSTSTSDRARGTYLYSVERLVSGYDGNDIAAAIGRVQLKKLPEFTARRNRIRDRYNTAFGSTWQGNHLYPYFVDSTDQVSGLIDHLRDQGIGAGYHYPGTGWTGVSLPIYPDLTDAEQEYVIEQVLDWRDRAKDVRTS